VQEAVTRLSTPSPSPSRLKGCIAGQIFIIPFLRTDPAQRGMTVRERERERARAYGLLYGRLHSHPIALHLPPTTHNSGRRRRQRQDEVPFWGFSPCFYIMLLHAILYTLVTLFPFLFFFFFFSSHIARYRGFTLYSTTQCTRIVYIHTYIYIYTIYIIH